MIILKHCFFLIFIYTYINLISSENFPFFIHADQVFLKCSNGKLESLNNSTSIHSTCIQIKQHEQYSLYQFFIQCPDGRLYLEYNRMLTFYDQVSEYSIANLEPKCFLNHHNHYLKYNQSTPYQIRYTSDNGTLTQIISFQCYYNLIMMTNENSKLNEEFYLFFKLMNYSLCRYLIQFISSNGKCNQYYQQIYKIQGQIKNSICYYQLGTNSSEISLEYFDQLTYRNLSSSKQPLHSAKSVNRTIIIITTLITIVSLLICLAIFIAMYPFGLCRL
ncbi:unnamed protein product [Rotaria sordida]|uniref:Transmembrane protein n=2 Tax=Rotaria sordida TaxID=392033 RepID=A0A814A4Y9_9BILA|nr:unnamed protein product [Rotaria sordida]CAF0909608.1 unnamed protein product [Rotaria sordida]CAF3567769.1 unnamed protein product [Rotaria sordida]CAF3643535.1 unnamed protein product [Rotaria sordida]